MSLVPVPSEQAAGAACTSCGAALVADQRYCLSCGAPCSPVRLAFLDILEGERGGLGTPSRDGWVSPSGAGVAPGGYMPVAGQPGLDGWLRRYSGLLSLFTVLLTCLIAGLLVGHWVTQSKSSGPTLIKVEGLSGAPGAAASTTTPSTAATSSTASKSSAAEEAEEAKAESKETKAEKAPPPAPVKVNSTKLKKLSTTTGKKHAEEINALGAQPIETGG
jgi:hypothetical protein